MTKTGKPTAAGILTIVAGGMGIGICALKRRCWGMALAGAICALPMIPIGTTLGVLSVIFVSLGRREFA